MPRRSEARTDGWFRRSIPANIKGRQTPKRDAPALANAALRIDKARPIAMLREAFRCNNGISRCGVFCCVIFTDSRAGRPPTEVSPARVVAMASPVQRGMSAAPKGSRECETDGCCRHPPKPPGQPGALSGRQGGGHSHPGRCPFGAHRHVALHVPGLSGDSAEQLSPCRLQGFHGPLFRSALDPVRRDALQRHVRHYVPEF